MADLLLWTSAAILSHTSLTKEFMMDMALDEIPASQCGGRGMLHHLVDVARDEGEARDEGPPPVLELLKPDPE